MDLERIILFLVLAVAPLFNLLYRAWQQQQERGGKEAPGGTPPPPMPAPPSELPPKPHPEVREPILSRPPVRQRRPSRQRSAIGAGQPVLSSVPARVSPRARSHKTVSLRRAIVMLELVGPCRALEPYEPR